MRIYFKISMLNKKISIISEKRFYDLIDFANCYYDYTFHEFYEFDFLFSVKYYFAFNNEYSDYSPICFYVDLDLCDRWLS